MHVLGIIGSLREHSFNKSLMEAFMELKPVGVDMTIADIASLPLYNEDLEATFPESALKLKKQVESADVIIIATPEYNRSIPGVLKNAIDWISRPYGKNSFMGKKVLVIGASVGPIGTALAQYDLKKMLLHGNAHVLGQPEFFVGNAGSKMTDGVITDTATREHITAAWSILTS
jgi:chromate reductase, NAD(P)H dehydrogenase (quinone)